MRMRMKMSLLCILLALLMPITFAWAGGESEEDKMSDEKMMDEMAVWDGADNLPVNPLACGAGGSGTVVALPYDGGQPAGAVSMSGKAVTVVDVPKLHRHWLF